MAQTAVSLKYSLTLIINPLQVYVAKDEDSIQKGAFSTIQEAYDHAKPNSRIKFAPDYYSESIIIR
jgi:hypothetical protein